LSKAGRVCRKRTDVATQRDTLVK